jgi:hypothetical protein
MRTAGAVAAGLLAALVAAPASATQVLREGTTLVLRADPGEVNHLAVSDDPFSATRLHFGDRSGYPLAADPALGCEGFSTGFGTFTDCPADGITEVRLEGGDGDDELDISPDELPRSIAYVLDGGPGADHLEGPTTDFPVTLLGGDGDDQVLGGQGPDVLDGGPGDDTVDGNDGDDRVHGGPGDDVVSGGRRRSTDVVDGGPGTDSIVTDWSDTTAPPEPIRVTLDGVANDGRAGENDDVRGVERIRTPLIATLVAGGDPVGFEVERSPVGPSRLVGSPGADRLAGYAGDDTIVGGRGRDVIFGHLGDDVIEARDGERDVIDCGDGRGDLARVDRVDVVGHCERVVRARPRSTHPLARAAAIAPLPDTSIALGTTTADVSGTGPTAGWTRLTFTAKRATDFGLARLDPGQDPAAFATLVAQSPPDVVDEHGTWVAGGSTAPGAEYSTALDLAPGTYAVVIMGRRASVQAATFVVAAPPGGRPAPVAATRIGLRDFAITGPAAMPTADGIEIVNDGRQLHELVLGRLGDQSPAAAVKLARRAQLRKIRFAQAPVPLVGLVSGGTTNVVTPSLPAGRYLLLCHGRHRGRAGRRSPVSAQRSGASSTGGASSSGAARTAPAAARRVMGDRSIMGPHGRARPAAAHREVSSTRGQMPRGAQPRDDLADDRRGDGASAAARCRPSRPPRRTARRRSARPRAPRRSRGAGRPAASRRDPACRRAGRRDRVRRAC